MHFVKLINRSKGRYVIEEKFCEADSFKHVFHGRDDIGKVMFRNVTRHLKKQGYVSDSKDARGDIIYREQP